MEKEKLEKKYVVNAFAINNNYNLKHMVEEFLDIEGYPHIKSGISKDGGLILKYLKYNKSYLRFLEDVYSYICDIEEVNVPLVNKNDCYITLYKKKAFIIFERLQLPKEVPSAKWWAKTLSKIHAIPAFRELRIIRISKLVLEVSNILNNSKKYMSSDIYAMLSKLLYSVDSEKIYTVYCVLNHGDALDSNVLKYKETYKIIDFESACLAPREYDIQRKMWDYAINCRSTDMIEKFWEEFISEYIISNQEIDISLLYDLYVIDFCRTICWLFIVSSDKTRMDYSRQKIESIRFVDALRKGKIHKMLTCIERKEKEK